MASDTSTQSLFGRLSARSSFVSNKEIKINIQLLDDNETISHEFKRSANAQTILDYVCECTGIQEKDYFGLRVLDASKHRYWVDLTKPISHILKYQNKADHLALRLRFRFYPADPKNLKEEITRYQLLVQLQRDLLHGRLHCQSTLAAQLAAFALQSQLGDYDPSKHPDGYVSEYKLLLKQTPKIEERIAECHKALRGVSASNAELQFLEKASALDTYGFDPYTVKDQSRTVYLGVTHKGVLVFYTNQKAHHIPWTQLSKVDYIGKEIRITPSEDYLPPADISELNFSRDSTLNATANGETKKVTKRDKKMKLVYLCPTGTFAKHLWIHILSQQAFFTEAKATEVKQKFSKARIPLLTRGTTFRYTPPRVAKELENDSAESDGESLLRSQRSFTRYSLTRQAPRGEQPWLNKYHTLPNLHKTSNANGGLVSSPQNQEAQPEENKAVSTSCLDSSIISNISAPFEASETSSQSRASSPLTRENMTQITIHLRKVEEKAKSAVTADRASSPLRPIGEEEVKRTTRLVESQPLMTSTPLASKNHEESNGRLLNKEDEGEEATKVTTSQRIVNVVFATFLVTLLIVALLIALFENSSSLEWEQRVPALSTVRHAIYEPARHFALSRYQKYLSR